MHGKTSLQKAFQAELKVPFSNENNAEGKMNASLKEKECYVSNSCSSREDKDVRWRPGWKAIDKMKDMK